jgi:uncharacterized protein YoxC
MNEITLTFTVGQLFAVIGALCLLAITIYLVGVLKELKKTLQQVHETVYNVNEMIEDIQTTKMVITNRISELKKFRDFSKTWEEIKDKFTRKKNKKQGED